MQLSLIDPREHPIATAEMLDDAYLKGAIGFVRAQAGREDSDWPFVERLCDIEGRPVWAVDDAGMRYVVVRRLIFDLDDLKMADEKIRTSAAEVFGRLDGGANTCGNRGERIPRNRRLIPQTFTQAVSDEVREN